MLGPLHLLQRGGPLGFTVPMATAPYTQSPSWSCPPSHLGQVSPVPQPWGHPPVAASVQLAPLQGAMLGVWASAGAAGALGAGAASTAQPPPCVPAAPC